MAKLIVAFRNFATTPKNWLMLFRKLIPVHSQNHSKSPILAKKIYIYIKLLILNTVARTVNTVLQDIN